MQQKTDARVVRLAKGLGTADRLEKVLTNFVKTGAMPFLASATALVRRFLPPGTSDHDAMCAAISLMDHAACSYAIASSSRRRGF